MMERQEWLEARRKGIGGSDIAAVCGLSRWKAPMDVYLDKIGAASEVEQNEAMYWGSAIESLLRERFAADHPEFVVKPGDDISFSLVYPWLVASFDGLVYQVSSDPVLGRIPVEGLTAGWEGKTASSFKRKEWDGDSIPDEYWLQCQHYMAVSGLPRWYLSVLIGGNDYREFVIERDDEAIEMLVERARAFWELVESRTPPAIDGSEASSKVLERMYPAEDVVLEPIPVVPEAEELARAYLEAREALKSAKLVVDTLENELKALTASHALVETPSGYKVEWKVRQRVGIDTKELQAREPEIAEKYRKVTEYRVFGVKAPEEVEE